MRASQADAVREIICEKMLLPKMPFDSGHGFGTSYGGHDLLMDEVDNLLAFLAIYHGGMFKINLQQRYEESLNYRCQT